MQFLDFIYHSNFYQNWTSKGPLKMPSDLLSKGASVTETAAKTVIGWVSPSNEGQIKQIHVPQPRNWTRAVNGLAQAVAMLIVAVVLKARYKFPLLPLLLMSSCWSSASARHLIAANYPNDLIEYNLRNAKLFFQ